VDQLVDCCTKLEGDDCPVFYNSQDTFSTAKGVAIAALADYQPFEIKLSQWIQVLVKSITGFDVMYAKRVFVIADEFKKVDEFKITMALEKNQRDNENSMFHFIPILQPSAYLKELAKQGQCRYHELAINNIGQLISDTVKQSYGAMKVNSANDLEGLRQELESMEKQDENREGRVI